MRTPCEREPGEGFNFLFFQRLLPPYLLTISQFSPQIAPAMNIEDRRREATGARCRIFTTYSPFPGDA